MKVLSLPEVREYQKELTETLYNKGYFSFIDTAEKYVEELFAKIETSIPRQSKKDAPPYFARYGDGMYYARFKKNNTTQWYVFFNIYAGDNDEKIYLIRYVGNNHSVAQYL